MHCVGRVAGNDLANTGHPTEPINATKHASVNTINLDKCGIRCLEPDAFGFAGAASVTTVYLQYNPAASYPEGLLWNTPSLMFLYARANTASTLPEKFLQGQSKLMLAFFSRCSFTTVPVNILQGLGNLRYLSFSTVPLDRMPNMDHTPALLVAYYTDMYNLHMDDNEIEHGFDNLVNVQTLMVSSTQVHRVPWTTNMRSMMTFHCTGNQITTIEPGDFKGATRLVELQLSGNKIVSVAPEAFANLHAFNVLPKDWHPLNFLTNQSYLNAYGMGLYLPAGVGAFGSGKPFEFVPLSLGGNPVECVWVGPKISDIDCSSCTFGYESETTGGANGTAATTTCVKPTFRPRTGWMGRAQLSLQDHTGTTLVPDAAANTPVTLLTGQTYTIPAPSLEPKERSFVGYELPSSKIYYELDFLLGAEVDFGCGTTAFGDATLDVKQVPKTDDNVAHPLSMYSHQWQYGFSAGATTGFFPQPCPRYHRFAVTHPGNFTFDTCASMFSVVLQLYKRTDNLSESEPRMTLDYGGFHSNQTFDVPLHANDKEWTRVRTGLKRVHADHYPSTFIDWLNAPSRTAGYPSNWPVPTHDDAISPAANGCPTSMGTHRTLQIDEVGEYFLETSGSDWSSTACRSFDVKMTCSGGAQTIDPAESDPQGFFVDTSTGAITGTPRKARKGYRMRLRAVDAAATRTTVADWTFDVQQPPTFSLNPSAGWSTETDSKLASKYHVAETHLLPKPRVTTDELLQHPAGSNFDKVVYLLSAQPVGAAFGPTLASPSNCTGMETDGNQVVSALTDVATGAGAINIQCEGKYMAKLVVRDGAGDEVVLRSWEFEVLRRDIVVPEYGPNARDCVNGDRVDGAEMDQAFTCDCSATRFTGPNCDVEPAAADSGDNDTTLYVAGAVLAVLVLGAVVVFLVLRYQRYQRSMLVTDFQAQLAQMKEEGLVDAEISGDRVPRELKRTWLMFIDRLGQGQFGEVWKGLLSDGDNPSIPEYIVAAKTVKEADTNETTVACEVELMKEALLMAQVEPHPHLVSIIGVITRGRPKTLLLSFCEHGEMGGTLKKRAADGDAFDLGTKHRFCSEIAAGMQHLGEHNFIHRDLAARNVLLGSGMVCKVADFGLSRRVQTEDNTGDYYRSTSGVLPVRWTAPEGLTSQKFSAASDVWSFGVVCVEIFQDGSGPYPAIRSNPEVMTFVNNGKVHPQPAGCTDGVYGELLRCFSFEPEARPPFADLSVFFAALVPEYAGSGTPSTTKPITGGDAQYMSLLHEQQHYLSLLHNHTGGDPDVFNELREGGDIKVDETYSTSEYLQLGAKRRASIEKEDSIVGGLDGLEISAKLGQATEELHQHSSQYHAQFDEWRSDSSLVELKSVVAKAGAKFAGGLDYVVPEQPNPWGTQGINVTSKRYLARVITVFNGTGGKYDVSTNPVDDVVAACGSIVGKFGAGVTLVPGPPKKEQRIMEKARDGNYAAVRDLGRLSLVVADIGLVPGVVAALSDCESFEAVRIKNRLDPGDPAVDSAGYRDVQVLVREPGGGWIVEIQVIPKEMYELKRSCGHSGYTKYRFVLEACKRARVRQAANAFKGGPGKSSAAAAEPVETRGACSRCGAPVLVTQEREQDPATGLYSHKDTAECAGTSHLKKHSSRNAVHPLSPADAQGETQA